MGAAATWKGGRGRRDGRQDGLPLALPAPSPLPGRMKPEAAVPCAAPFDSSDWLFSVDWEGARALLFAGADGGIRLQDERLEDVTGRFPELATAGAALGGRVAVLDGVVAILDPEGRPDLAALGLRLADPGGASAVYLATDLLHLDGAPTLTWPLERRLEALAGCLGPDARIQHTEPVRGEGLALARAAAERGLGAVLARRADGAYLPGVASPDRLRIDLAGLATCVVVGMASRAPGWGERRLILAEQAGGRLARSAVVTASLSPAVAAWVDRWADELEVAPSGLDAGDVDGVRWLRPHLAATVRHAGRETDGSLRQPVLVAVRDDVDPLWCRRRPPVPPPGSTGPPATPFRPTVLVTLPISS